MKKVKEYNPILFEKAVQAAWPGRLKNPPYIQLRLFHNWSKGNADNEYVWIHQKEWRKRLRSAGFQEDLVRALCNPGQGQLLGNLVGGKKNTFVPNYDFRPIFLTILDLVGFERLKGLREVKEDDFGMLLFSVRPVIEVTLRAAYLQSNNVAAEALPSEEYRKINSFLSRIKNFSEEKGKVDKKLKGLSRMAESIASGSAFFSQYLEEYQNPEKQWLWNDYAEQHVPIIKAFSPIAEIEGDVRLALEKLDTAIKQTSASLPRKGPGRPPEDGPRQVVKSLAQTFDGVSGWWSKDMSSDDFKGYRRKFIFAAMDFCGHEFGDPRLRQLIREVPIQIH